MLERCARQRRVLLAVRVARRAFELIWPGAVTALVVLAACRALRLDLRWAFVVLAVWIAGSAYRLMRERHALAVPDWFWVAYADRHGRAGGTLLHRFERKSARDPVPRSVLDVSLWAPTPWRSLFGAFGIVAAYALCLAWPLPAAPLAQHAPRLVPLPVERVRQVVAQVVPRDAQAHAFVAGAKKSLQALEAKQGGLRRPDFDALERIERHARDLIERNARTVNDARRSLDKLESLLAAAQAPGSGGDERAAGALREAERQAREALGNAGVDAKRFEELLNQAKRNAAKSGGRSPAQAGDGKQPFAASDLDALRAEIGKLQKHTQAELQRGEERGGYGPTRGPGAAPIEFAHEPTWIDGARFDTKTFDTHPDRDTVLLSSAFTKRDDTPVADPLARSPRTFERGSDTEFWDKQLTPRRRALLQRYFGTSTSDE